MSGDEIVRFDPPVSGHSIYTEAHVEDPFALPGMSDMWEIRCECGDLGREDRNSFYVDAQIGWLERHRNPPGYSVGPIVGTYLHCDSTAIVTDPIRHTRSIAKLDRRISNALSAAYSR